jgi:hypothetical protein
MFIGRIAARIPVSLRPLVGAMIAGIGISIIQGAIAARRSRWASGCSWPPPT